MTVTASSERSMSLTQQPRGSCVCLFVCHCVWKSVWKSSSHIFRLSQYFNILLSVSQRPTVYLSGPFAFLHACMCMCEYALPLTVVQSVRQCIPVCSCERGGAVSTVGIDLWITLPTREDTEMTHRTFRKELRLFIWRLR